LNSFTFKNSDKSKISLGLTEGKYIFLDKMEQDEIRERRHDLDEKFKKLKIEDKFTLSKTRVIVKNLPKGIDSKMLRLLVNDKLLMTWGDLKNKRFIKNIGIAAAKTVKGRVESQG